MSFGVEPADTTSVAGNERGMRSENNNTTPRCSDKGENRKKERGEQARRKMDGKSASNNKKDGIISLPALDTNSLYLF